MNWEAMLVAAAAIAVACALAGVMVWLIERGLHLAWVLAGLFVLVILAVGLAA